MITIFKCEGGPCPILFHTNQDGFCAGCQTLSAAVMLDETLQVVMAYNNSGTGASI